MYEHYMLVDSPIRQTVPSRDDWERGIEVLLDNEGATIDRYTAIARDEQGQPFTIVASRDQSANRGILEVRPGKPDPTDDKPISIEDISGDVARAIWRAYRLTVDERSDNYQLLQHH